MKKRKTVVAGYTLIKREQVGEAMVVLGHNPDSMTPFVTWKAYEHSQFKSFEHGHYCATRQEAMIDYHQRLTEAWEHYFPAKTQEKGNGAKGDILTPPSPEIRRTREVEAESVAYVVSQHFGLDTSEYSFGYIAN